MKLTIQSIIRFEQLRGKPFASIDYTKEGDLMALLYAMNYNGEHTYQTFEMALKSCEKQLKKLTNELLSEVECCAQFQKVNPVEWEKPNQKEVYVKDIVSALIVDGMEPDFILNKMQYTDLSMYVEAYEKKKQEQMESERFWTYISMQPHLTKKLKPEQICPFPWEAGRIKEEADKNIRENEEIFNKAMQMKFNKKWLEN